MASAKPGGYNNVRIVVVGDQGTGKSSLIIALALGIFSHSVPPVVPPTGLPADYYPDKVPLTIVDTWSRHPHHQIGQNNFNYKVRVRLCIQLVVASQVKVPVIVVCCKLDLKKLPEFNFEAQIVPIMHQFPEIETCIECSALQQTQWALMTLLDPINILANLMYIGYTVDPRSAFHITRRRRIDRKKNFSQRNVFQCFVFRPKGSGKATLLNAFVGRTASDKYESTVEPRFAANVVEHNGTVNILVLREMPPDGVASLLSSKDSLAACDVALFMYDRYLLELLILHDVITSM
ncbi:hypothetical protein EJ110_NYTH40701 [Nymphaea thermarum]|nr:hypothetical protein EJ110_NYTH40701 [Nymphaea thermarum]